MGPGDGTRGSSHGEHTLLRTQSSLVRQTHGHDMPHVSALGDCEHQNAHGQCDDDWSVHGSAIRATSVPFQQLHLWQKQGPVSRRQQVWRGS